jgi:phosphoglycerol transferase MdoB-like AlkP superfamily enzyme
MQTKAFVIDKLKWIYFQLLTKPLKISVVALFYLLVCYTLLRLGFFIANHRFFADASAGEVIYSFIYGLVFDISALLILNGPLLLLYNFPGNPTRWKWFRGVIISLFWMLNLSFITLNLADYGYFPVVQRRLMFEVYTLVGEILTILPTLLVDFWYLLLFLAISGFLFVFLSWKLFKRADKAIEYAPVLWKEIVCLVILMLLMVPGIKGGLQRKPIRQAHAFFSINRSIGYLTLNSTFTILKSILQASVNERRLMPDEKAVRLVEKMIRDQNEEMLDPKYPFLRKKSHAGAPQLKNIVIFVMESWTADYIGCVRPASAGTPYRPAERSGAGSDNMQGAESVTPFFDSLAMSGTLFTNFLAVGHRSVIATPAILSSLAGFYTKSKVGKEDSFVESQSESNCFIALGNILSKYGYTTSFQHGANTGALGLDAYSHLCGFKNYYGKEDYVKLNGPIQGGVEGVWDEEFFQDMIKRIDTFKSPFCSGVFSLTSHEPFRLPPHRKALFDKYTNETDFQKILRYTDYSLEQFFRVAKTKPWFNDTIFIIVADHTTHSKVNNFYSCYHVPLLIYAPPPPNESSGVPDSRPAGGVGSGQRIDRIGSQVDILPTLLDILRIPAVHSSMGRSLLDTSSPHYSVLTDGTMYAIFSDRFVFLNDLEKDIGLYDYHIDPMLKNNLQSANTELSVELKEYLFAYIQSVSGAIAHNRICRNSDLK